MVAQAMDDQVTALAHFEAALELDRDCVAFDPDNLRARHALAIALYRCGAAAVKLRQCELARSYFQRALDQCNLLTGYPQIEALIREIEVRLGEPCP
jgi:tetratricopeptide (TPR) repeat protein